MPTQQLKEFLDANNVRYVSTTHSAAYTAQEVASIAHVKGKELAKTVMVKIDDELAMAVLPASFQVDLTALKTTAGAGSAVLATRRSFEASSRNAIPERCRRSEISMGCRSSWRRLSREIRKLPSARELTAN